EADAILVDGGGAIRSDRGREVLPFVQLDDVAIDGQARTAVGAVEDLQDDPVARATGEEKNVVQGLAVAEVEEPLAVGDRSRVDPGFEGNAVCGGDRGRRNADEVVLAIERGRGAGVAGDRAGCAEEDAVAECGGKAVAG